MYTKAIALAILLAYAEARFGQEQLPISAISSISAGEPGVAQTLAGGAISTLLGAANPCAKLQAADELVAQLGDSADVIAAAIGLVAAEQNFNPSAVSVPSICSDVTLPVTKALRGVVPLIDPAVTGSDVENALSATSITTPFDAVGLSVADVMAAQGFTNFTTKDLAGKAGVPAAGGAVVAAPASAANVTAKATVSAAVIDCAAAPTTLLTVTKAAAATATAAAVIAPAAAGAGAITDAVVGTFTGFVASSIADLDFGTCTPTMKFEPGLNGRKETEFTFQAQDPVVNKGQQEALNPNIITRRICDQLGNVCGANEAASAACDAAQAKIEALGTRDASTADAWNEALGFAGTELNPDGAPVAGLVGHA